MRTFDHLEEFRCRRPVPGSSQLESLPGDTFGVFYLRFKRAYLIAIASAGDPELMPWEHVSVQAKDYVGERIPTWDEMCFTKELFWSDTETVMQLHPPKADYVNIHPHVLHLWRPTSCTIPTPPKIAV